MNGTKTFHALAWFAAGAAVGCLIARHVGKCRCGDGRECRNGEKPPLRVKPVPISKKGVPVSGAAGVKQERQGASE